MFLLAVPITAVEMRLISGHLRTSFSVSDILGATAPLEFKAYESMLKVGLS